MDFNTYLSQKLKEDIEDTQKSLDNLKKAKETFQNSIKELDALMNSFGIKEGA